MMAVFDPQIPRICLIFSARKSLYEITRTSMFNEQTRGEMRRNH